MRSWKRLFAQSQPNQTTAAPGATEDSAVIFDLSQERLRRRPRSSDSQMLPRRHAVIVDLRSARVSLALHGTLRPQPDDEPEDEWF